MKTMTLLNRTGDITIGWAPEDNDKMIAMVEEKMKAGFTFFVVKGEDHVRLRKIGDLNGAREVILDDKGAESLFKAGKVGIVERAKGVARDVMDTIRPAKTALEVATNHTVAVRRMAGG